MKRLVFLIVASLIPFYAFSDAQINQSAANGQFIHVPFDANDTDREFYVGLVGSGLIQDGAVLSVRAIEVRTYLCKDLPEEITNLAQGKTLLVSAGDVGETCLVTDVNGDATAVEDWQVRHTLMTDIATTPFGICEVQHKIWCRVP